MNNKKILNKIREKRSARSRARIFGTAQKPRLSVFRSNNFTYVQLINDSDGKTLVSASTRELKKKSEKNTKTQEAISLGSLISKKALEKNIKSAVFDRGSYKYHGRIKAVAEEARKSGLKI